MYRRIGIVLVLTTCWLLLPGCGLMDSHVKQFDLENGVAADVLKRLADGGLGQVSAAGQGIEPGWTVEAGTKYYATAYYKGLAGQFAVNANGQLSVLTPEQEATVDAILRNKSLNDADRRERIFAVINRLVPPTPPAVASQPASAPAE